MPAHRKPMPVTTCPIILVTSPPPFSVIAIDSKTNIAAPEIPVYFFLIRQTYNAIVFQSL
jgi:hypothetical protein